MNIILPTSRQLLAGAIFGGIVTAVMAATNQMFSSFRSWNGNIYVCDGRDSREGVIVFERGFSGDGTGVGLFFDANSDLNTYEQRSQFVNNLRAKLLPNQTALVDLALNDYLRESVDEQIVPLVTAAIWSATDGTIASYDTWEETMQNGVSLIHKELLGFGTEAIVYWTQSYEMPQPLVDLCVKLFRLRTEQFDATVVLDSEDVHLLGTVAHDPLLRWCRHAFSGLNIFFPSPTR